MEGTKGTMGGGKEQWCERGGRGGGNDGRVRGVGAGRGSSNQKRTGDAGVRKQAHAPLFKGGHVF